MACVHPYLIDPYPRCMKRNKKNQSNSNHWWQDIFVYTYMYVFVYVYIYIPVYNVSIYTSLHATTTILYWITSRPGKSKKKKTLRISQLSRPHLLGRRLADANKEKVKITGTPEVMSPRTFQITDKDIFFQAVQIPHSMRRVGGICVSRFLCLYNEFFEKERSGK